MLNSLSLKLLVLCLCVGVSACASTPQNETSDNAEVKNPDPFEKVNRVTFAFNDTLDQWILKPVAKGYKAITPDVVELGVSNFFDNLQEVPNVVNDLLQGKWNKAAYDGGRFVFNSTFGVAGLFDIAKYGGLTKNDPESFGQTFSYWGLSEGPYLVLPFLGPSTVTDAIGLPIGWEIHPLEGVEDEQSRISLTALGLLDTRAGLLDAESLLSGDKYVFIRGAYLQRREYLVRDGEESLEDLEGFGEDFEGFDEDF